MKPTGRWPLLAGLFFCLLGADRLHAQILDLNGNGMSDIWELIYGASGLDPNADTDGDGVANWLESIAGTNPFNSNSVPRIAQIAYLGTNFSVSLPSVLGKSYQLQSSQALDVGSWTDEGSMVARTGTVVTITAAVNPGRKFFRVVISDVDTDGDGLSDWEELQLGLDPAKAASNGQLDRNGQPLGDYGYVTNRLAAQNVVTLTASNPTATVPDADPAADTGSFTITRGGFPLNTITVQLGVGGTAIEASDYAPLPRSVILPVGVNAVTSPVTPLASSTLKSGQPVTMSVHAGAGYAMGAPNSASVLIYPSPTPTGTGLTGQYYNGASLTYGNITNFNPANLRFTRLDPTVDYFWSTNSPDPLVNSNLFTVRWKGQVQPQYSEPYTFFVRSDEGVKLYVNGQLLIDKWVGQSVFEWSGVIALQAGIRYDIQLDYFDYSGSAEAHLSWNSPSLPREIIPMNRLYPSGSAAPAAIISPATAVAFLNQPFTYVIAGSNPSTNLPTKYGASPLPPGLTFTNSTNGIISGIPIVAGEYQIVISATNAAGTGSSMLDLMVIDTGSLITREVWTGVPGANVASIPINTPPTSTTVLTNLAGITGFGQDYGERIRGYLTAPVSGNYYFWLAASNTAELWISNDGEPANKVKRAYVANGASALSWTNEPNQLSPWLALVAGQRYYIEVLHKSGVGAGDNVAVGWLRPGQAGTGPSQVVPGFVLSPYVAPVLSSSPGALYAATLLAQAPAHSDGIGTATLRLSTDETQATLRYSATNLSSPVTGKHIHADPYLANPSQIIFDIDAATPQPDGGYVWVIAPSGTLSAADILELIKENKAYLNIHTANYPAGEIRGNFSLANGSPVFTPPPVPPAWTDDHTSANAASRFLAQATFGPSPADIAAVQSMGYDGWINDQLAQPPSHHLPLVLTHPTSDPTTLYPSTLTFNAWWQQSITAPDQLRQRVAFALSEIMVVSDIGTLNNNGRVLSDYYDTLLDSAFGNFRNLLETVTLTPAMGLYLDMRANDKGDQISGRHPNENYAREIMQLFSIGLNRMWPDGTLVLDSRGNLVPTYDQNVILGYARVFTGWNYHQSSQGNGRLPVNFGPGANYIDPMTLVPTHHEPGSKRILDNIVLPAATGNQADSTKPEFDAYGLNDLEAALDAIFNNQNVGPFICRQLIQRLVTSTPSRDYIYRVVQVFNDNGAGIRGDLQAVIKAILLDYEARSGVLVSEPAYGKQREPLLRVTAATRAFPAPPPLSSTYSQNGDRPITVTTPSPHRLANGDVMVLEFTSGTPLPTSTSYTVGNVTASTFTINAAGLVSGSYTQSVSTLTSTNVVTDTNGVTVTNIVTLTNSSIKIALSNHGLAVSNQVYLAFTTGGASNGQYQVASILDASHFTVAASDLVSRSGNLVMPRWNGGFTQSRTNVTISTAGNHSLNPGDNVYLNFATGTGTDGQYQVVTVPDATHFTVIVGASANQAQPTITVYPLVAPPLVRSGYVTVQSSTWNLGASDGDLTQTPLRSPTVFNFFFPDFKFPGMLASAGLTTPEFQLTSDTDVANQMNFLYGGTLLNTNNPNGLTSFRNGNGSMMLDLSPWMTAAYTSDSGIPSLVDGLNTLLMGGQMSSTVKSLIVNYAASTTRFPYTAPTATPIQMRDRVRAVLHLILTSPDFTIQK